MGLRELAKQCGESIKAALSQFADNLKENAADSLAECIRDALIKVAESESAEHVIMICNLATGG